MTVPVNDRKRMVETTAGQTYVETDFRVDLAEYLTVQRKRAGVVAVLVLDIDYTVSQLGNDAGCRVTFTPDPAEEGDVYVLLGALPVARTSSFVALGGVSAASLDQELDAVARQLQEMDREVARAFRTDLFSAEPVFDFGGRRILDVGAPVDPGDAVNLGSIQAALDAATDIATATAEGHADQTAADRVQTGLDRAATGADRVQTGLDRDAAAASAAAAASSEAAALGQLGIGRLAHVGDIKFQTTTETPAGWRRLKRDPQLLNKLEYPELNAKYAADGYPYGSTVDGFYIPGAAGLFLRPWDDTSTHDPDVASRLHHDGTPGAGNVIGSRQASENKQHSHGGETGEDYPDHAHWENGQGTASPDGYDGGAVGNVADNNGGWTGGASARHKHAIASSGGNEARPANIALPLIILVNPTEASAAHTPFGLPYTWNTGTADADPGTGKLRINHATLASATYVYVSKVGVNTADFTAIFTLANDIVADARAVLTIYNAGSPNNVIVAAITGAVVDAGTYLQVPIAILSSAGVFSAGAPLCVQVGLTAGGPQGDAGWSPTLATVEDGERRVLKVVGWQGGEGTPPAINKYIGAAGLVDAIGDGVDVRGAVGGNGWSPICSIEADGARRVLKVVGWGGGDGPEPDSGYYIGPEGPVVDKADAVDLRGPSGAGTGDVVGPGAAVIGNLPTFGNVDGTSLVDSGKSVSIDGTLASNSDALIPTQKAVKTYCDNLIAANDAMVFKGVIDCSSNPNYPAANRGDTYRVSVAGKIGGGSGPNVEIGDILLCQTDSTATGNHATVGTAWAIIQVNIDGALTTAAIGVSVQAYDAQLSSLIRQLVKSVDFTITATESGWMVQHPLSDNNARTFTLPDNATVALPIGCVVVFDNEINTVTIAIAGTDTLVFTGAGSTGSRTLAANGFAIAFKTGATKWKIAGVGLS